jgi:hypothetical protein
VGAFLGAFSPAGEQNAMALTDVAVRSRKPLAKAYKVADGGGLYLLVTPTGGRLWRFKYRMHGIEKKLSLGRYPDVSSERCPQAA